MDAEDTKDIKKIIEAALFVSGRALSLNNIADIVGIASIGSVEQIINELIDDYNKHDSSLIISKLGNNYVMTVKENYLKYVSSIAGSPDISKGALRILAYVSKNEPIMQNIIIKSFGTSAYEYIKELLDKDFIKAAKAGRTKRLETTQKFTEYFNF
ncbi:MAG: SMC-Scp complex subunit ScpB [Candidatus Marsarchaeota archaeon]|nr:SMC-Scp complex subunit ScpB [Candidatus Marsarchaeota archaeon]